MRIFEIGKNFDTGSVELCDENIHHVVRVMRCRVGDTLTICDGAGMDYLCCVSEISKKYVACDVVSSSKNTGEASVHVTLFAGLSKGDRFEWILQKGCELGASKIVPFTSENCVIKLNASDATKKADRWSKIIRDGAKQSGRGGLLELGALCTFEQIVHDAANDYDLAIFLYECEKENTLKKRLMENKDAKRIAIITGPEGGFSPQEAERSQTAGLLHTTLGERILRCETAPIAALAAVMYEYEA